MDASTDLSYSFESADLSGKAGMDPFIYQYSIGGFIFLVGSLRLSPGYIGTQGAGRNLIVLTLGLAFFAGLQGYLEYSPKETLPPKPYDGGGPQPTDTMGTPLDYGIMIGYFVIILVIGTWFGRKQQTTKTSSSEASASPGG